MMRTIFLLSCLLLFSSVNYAQEFFPLWPDGEIPNSKGIETHHIEENQRITQVETPGFYTFFPAAEEQNEASVLILPSGGYQKLTYNLGGFQLAKWFNTHGISAFVLIYRLPNSPDLEKREAGPIQDAQRAMKIIRSKAEKWQLDPNKIGIFGSSAGGHLASTIVTHPEDLSKINDSLDPVSFQPNFAMLVSPVINLLKNTHQGSVDNFLGRNPSNEKLKLFSNHLQVKEGMPPIFLAHAQNDEAVPVENSLLFYNAMLKYGIDGSLHIFPKGGHSIGIYNKSELTNQWKDLSISWLKEISIIKNQN